MNRHSQPSRTDVPPFARSQRGSIVVYLALALVVFGVMAMAGASRFGASIMGVSTPNCATQARLMAESGVRYAMARLRKATDQPTLTDIITTLNGQTVTVDADKGLKFTLTVYASGTGAAQVSALGSACGGVTALPTTSTQASASGGVNVPAAGGGGIPGEGISFAGGDTPGFIPTATIGGSGAITVDAAGTVTLGGNLKESSGSIWYSGSRDVCVNGNCTLGSGLRAYFDLRFSDSAKGDGFVWALMSAESNTNASSGGDSTMGELLGYGGPGKLGLGIQPPKFGVEFDIYNNTDTGSACYVGNRADTVEDHLAFIFWGTESLACSGKTKPTTYDDNKHGAGTGTIDEPRNSANDNVDGPDNLGYFIRPGRSNDNWLQDGGLYRFRYEILRNTTANAQGNYCYKLRAWMKRSTDSIAPGMDNTTIDYDSPPELYRTFFLSPAMHAKMSHIFFGWSEGTGAETQLVTLTNFRLNFRGGAAPTYSPPPDYTAGWPMYEGSGTTVHNSNATNPEDGVIDGTGTTWVTGLGCPACSALDFSGLGFVRVQDNNSLDLTTAGSISAWIRVDTFIDNAGIVHKGQNSSFTDEAYSLQFGNGRRLRLYVTNAGGNTVSVQSSALPNTTGVWRHIAATWNSTELKLYVDGVLDNTQSNNSGITAYNSAGNLVIGAQTYTGVLPGYPFYGAIDEVYLYKRVLTAAEIAALAVARP